MTSMEDMTLDMEDGDFEEQAFTGKKPSDRKPSHDDYISLRLLHTYYAINKYGATAFYVGVVAIPLLCLLLFYLFISDSTSNLIACFSLLTSFAFILVSLWMLCWILDKDAGSRDMQDISDPIREGSEGFFVTQYGTIFKLAFVCSVGLFLIYLNRSATAEDSELNKFVGPTFMALITSISFLIGANCSALSGYAGIWVSVRANVRVAAAARKCYNEALQICFRGGAFSAIMNVGLAIFGISALYLFLSFVFWVNMPPEFEQVPIQELSVLLVGFGFGASFVAMFA